MVMITMILLTSANRHLLLFCAVHLFVVHSREFVAFVCICLSVSQLCICLLKDYRGPLRTPQIGEWWLCCVSTWDPENRCDDEEYWGEVLADANTEGKFHLQDLEEADVPEYVSLDRFTFIVVCVC